MYNVGVVGGGFVGGALSSNLKDAFCVQVFDKDPTKATCSSLEEMLRGCDIVFVCVPTPQSQDNSCDTSIVRSVVHDIAKIRKDLLVVIKSTVPPKTTKTLAEETGLDICFNPEFLTEVNAYNDFRYQKNIVIGADTERAAVILSALYENFNETIEHTSNIVTCSSTEAELLKYTANCFLAMKVIFANEMKKLCDTIGADYDAVVKLAKLDDRLGKTHWQVPGPDGKFGYGGSCFPKDMNALISFAEDNGVMLEMLALAEVLNKEFRE